MGGIIGAFYICEISSVGVATPICVLTTAVATLVVVG